MVISKISKIPTKLPKIAVRRRVAKKSNIKLDVEQVRAALRYIDDFWPELKHKNRYDRGSLIGLPHTYIVPALETGNFTFEEQYYWDSYFTSLGLSGKRGRMDAGMLENIIYMYKRFGLIPNASRIYHTSRSQPPLLSTYIFYVYDGHGKSNNWLKKKMAVAEEEYHHVWMNDEHPHWRNVYKGLSRYYDINVLHDLAEAESGWDMTPRFSRKCLDYLPVDLNALLFKYEMDFARAARILGEAEKEKEWVERAEHRKKNMDELMWDKRRKFYFDYDFTKKERGTISSLASYYPMWAGMVTEKQAKGLVDRLEKFETKHGLMTTLRSINDVRLFGSLNTQWARPNGWAPLHYIVIEGLERYGYSEEAARIARKWLRTNTQWFTNHGNFLEKYNVVDPKKPPISGVYPTQIGFGWTNGVYAYLAKRYVPELFEDEK
jgi:alpha,alpha-trehalase